MTAEVVWAVVAAAGDGRRLGHELPKAFVKLGDRPLLVRAIELFGTVVAPAVKKALAAGTPA